MKGLHTVYSVRVSRVLALAFALTSATGCYGSPLSSEDASSVDRREPSDTVSDRAVNTEDPRDVTADVFVDARPSGLDARVDEDDVTSEAPDVRTMDVRVQEPDARPSCDVTGTFSCGDGRCRLDQVCDARSRLASVCVDVAPRNVCAPCSTQASVVDRTCPRGYLWRVSGSSSEGCTVRCE